MKNEKEIRGFLFAFMGLAVLYALIPTPSGGVTDQRVEDESLSSLKNLNVLGSNENVGLKPVEEIYPIYENKHDIEEEESISPGQLPLRDTIEDTLFQAEENNANFQELESSILEDENIFIDAAEFNSAPTIQVLAESKRLKYRLIVLQHERYYRTNPSKLYVPTLKPSTTLSRAEFSSLFLQKSQPVIIPFEAMRHLNFSTTAHSLKELLAMYPNRNSMTYHYGAVNSEEEIDLGPAVALLSKDAALKKNKQGRNYPRNMKVNPRSVGKLGIEYPPVLEPGTKMMAPSVWFGASSSSTPLHSDCCDNFAMMITGTKRWTIAPPSEARLIKPRCKGGLCWGKKLEHPDEHAYTTKMKALRDQTQLITFDLKAGEMLYLPCGWFHHVENIGPTIMVNFWTKEKPFFLQKIDGDI